MPELATEVLSDLTLALLARASVRTCDLGPGYPHQTAHPMLKRLSPETLLRSGPPRDRPCALGCCAGLWLRHNYLDESHQLSQEIETPEGSYWHGMMHRREPDPENAKYWFARVGRHKIFPALRQAAAEIAQETPQAAEAAYLLRQETWDPMRWIDLCELARPRDALEPLAVLCRRVQDIEWTLLFDYCAASAGGRATISDAA